MSVLEKARIFDCDAPAAVCYVQFNPNTLEYSAGLKGQPHKGAVERDGCGIQQEPQAQQSPIADERGASLSVRLFYHTYNGPGDYTDVRAYINTIRNFLPAPTADGRASSPRITFAWGTMTHTGTLESFHVTYQMFAHDGTPVQAEVAISIRGEDPDVIAESNNQALGAESAAESARLDGDPTLKDISWLSQ